MSLDDHLRTDQDICLLVCKCSQNIRMSFFFSGCIQIHPQNLCLWKPLFYDFFDLLRSRTKSSDIG